VPWLRGRARLPRPLRLARDDGFGSRYLTSQSYPRRLKPASRIEKVGPERFLRGARHDLGEQVRVRRPCRCQRQLQARRRRQRLGVHRERPADPLGRVLQRAQHVVGLDRCRLPGHLGGDEGVTVTVSPHPAAEPQEGRHRRRHPAAVGAEQRLVQRPVHGGHQPEQGLVEGGHDRADLVGRGHPGHPELCGPP